MALNKLTQARNTIAETEHLIALMQDELHLLRHVVARYHKLHGGDLGEGELILPDTANIWIQLKENKPFLNIDETDLGIPGKYQRIVELLTALNQK